MNKKKCLGCGELLQTEDINEKGYVPFEKYIMSDNLICRRCFRLKNYSEIPKEIEDRTKYKEIVKKIVDKVDIVMPIFDSIDLESSMSDEIIDILEDKKIYTVLNKVDLLSRNYTRTEIAMWFKNILIENNVFPEESSYISIKNNFGINGILKKLKTLAGKEKNIKVAVIGVSNVGKSSLLNKLLKKDSLTVSKFSGTTKSSIKKMIKFKDINITIYDTPGLIPDGRLQELLPQKKANKLVPTKEISSRSINLKKDQYLMFSNLMYFKANNDMQLQIFASKNVELHVTNKEKYKELINNNFFKLLTEEESFEYLKNKFIEKNIKLDNNEDLSISGLGFIEVKRGSFDIDITYPEKVTVKSRLNIKKANKLELEDDMIW